MSRAICVPELLIQIPELLIQILEPLPLRGLISAMHVCQQWRSLVPRIDSPTRLRLLGLSFDDAKSPYPVSLDLRISYVEKIETTHSVVIPEPYRTILTEWPSSQPPPGMHWPHSVRFHASGFCSCPRHNHGTPDMCFCARSDVRIVKLLAFEGTFRRVVEEGLVPSQEDDYSWELFNKPHRLYTAEQNAQTMRFIRAQPAASVQWDRKWAKFPFQVLRLSRYHIHTPEATSDGDFVMILDGPTRGQIHAWASHDWYDGFEAEDFWTWNYSEWDAASTSQYYGVVEGFDSKSE